MYRCESCGEYFQTPKEIPESHGAPLPYREWLSVCPSCEGEDFAEYKMSDSVRRTDVIRGIANIMRYINEFCLGRKGIPLPVQNAKEELLRLFRECAGDDVISVSSAETDRLAAVLTVSDAYALYGDIAGRIEDE